MQGESSLFIIFLVAYLCFLVISFRELRWHPGDSDDPAQFQGFAKFGVFDIEQAGADGDPISLSHKTLDIGLKPADGEQYVEGVTPGYFIGSCAEALCSAELVGFAEAINNQLAVLFGGNPEDFSWESATFLGIFFKSNSTDTTEVCGVYGEDPRSESNAVDPLSGSVTEDPSDTEIIDTNNSSNDVNDPPQ